MIKLPKMETNKDKLIVKSCEIDEDVVRLSILKLRTVESIMVKIKVIGEEKDGRKEMANRTDGASVKTDC